MKKKTSSHLRHKFIEFVPNNIETGMIYISMENAVAIHKCACGCGQEVITPFSPTEWKLIFDGKAVTLNPSIGNWSFACRSHYWIKRNRILWAERWSQAKIEQNRSYDKALKVKYYNQSTEVDTSLDVISAGSSTNNGIWMRLRRLFRI